MGAFAVAGFALAGYDLRQLLRCQGLGLFPELEFLGQLGNACGPQCQKIEGCAETRMCQQTEYALSGALAEAGLQLPDFMHRQGEPTRNGDTLDLRGSARGDDARQWGRLDSLVVTHGEDRLALPAVRVLMDAKGVHAAFDSVDLTGAIGLIRRIGRNQEPLQRWQL